MHVCACHRKAEEGNVIIIFILIQLEDREKKGVIVGKVRTVLVKECC